MVSTLLAMVVSQSLIDRPDPEMNRVELFGSHDKLLIFKSSSSGECIIHANLTFLEFHGTFAIGVDVPEIDA